MKKYVIYLFMVPGLLFAAGEELLNENFSVKPSCVTNTICFKEGIGAADASQTAMLEAIALHRKTRNFLVVSIREVDNQGPAWNVIISDHYSERSNTFYYQMREVRGQWEVENAELFIY